MARSSAAPSLPRLLVLLVVLLVLSTPAGRAVYAGTTKWVGEQIAEYIVQGLNPSS